jgi:hypothetical protein
MHFWLCAAEEISNLEIHPQEPFWDSALLLRGSLFLKEEKVR